MRKISIEESFGQVRSMVELLAAPALVQREWMRSKGYPSDEIAQHFLDAVPLWFGRWREEGVLEPPVEGALMTLQALLVRLLVPEMRFMWVDEGLTDESNPWRSIRQLAQRALVEMDKSSRRRRLKGAT